jgi:isoquinoline 1-oxidoreductase beta subunit
MRRDRWPEEDTMQYDRLLQRIAAAQPAVTAEPHAAGISRRAFIKFSGAGAFAIGVVTLAPGALAQSAASGLKRWQQPGSFVAIAADGSITVQVNRLDFGQGIATALPMLVAEEMDADWSKVQGALAPAAAAYADPMRGMQLTGGSASVKTSWLQYREIGARARAMLVAAAARQWNVPATQITVAQGVLSGPAAQRATFGEMAEAAMREPVPETVALKAPGDFKLLGTPQGRKNARAIVTGRQGYGFDFGLDPVTKALVPGLQVVLVARPPVFGGKVVRYDAAAARAVHGVADVFEVDLDRGARGVAVVANGYWAAKQGRDALEPEWNLDGLERVDSARQLAQYQRLAREPGAKAKVGGKPAFDAERLVSAARRISAEYRFPYLAHAPMEPLNCVIDFKGDRCTVWNGTQVPGVDQRAVAAVLGLEPEQVSVNTLMAGGGFGRRAEPTSQYVADVARIAKAWRASGRTEPLKVMWSREDDIKGGYYRPTHVHRVEIGLDAQGHVLAWKHTIVGQSILAGTPFESFAVKDGVDGATVEGVANTPYVLPIALDVHHPKQNVPVLWWRSVGHTHTAFVMETLIDELAQAAGQDPVHYRRKLLGGKHPRHLAALDLAVAKSGYGKRKLNKGRAWGVAVHESFDSVVAYVVEASMKGRQPVLDRVTAGVHCNFAVNPLNVEAQVQGAALMGLSMCLPGAAVTLKDGVVEQSNFGDFVLPRIADMPQIAVHIVPSTEAPTGMGEPGLPPLAPAFANAVARLTGQRMRELPFRLT